MSMKTRATIEELYKVEGKAELVNGEIVCMSPTGGRPGRASLAIAMSLRLYEREHGGGYAFPNNVAFAVNLPHRESLARMSHGMSALCLICVFRRVHHSLRPRYAASMTMALQPSEIWTPSAPITSPVAPSSCGT